MFNVLKSAKLTCPSTCRKADEPCAQHSRKVARRLRPSRNLLPGNRRHTARTLACRKRQHMLRVHSPWDLPAANSCRGPATTSDSLPRLPKLYSCNVRPVGLVTLKSLSAENSSRSRSVKLSSVESSIRYANYAYPSRAKRPSWRQHLLCPQDVPGILRLLP